MLSLCRLETWNPPEKKVKEKLCQTEEANEVK